MMDKPIAIRYQLTVQDMHEYQLMQLRKTKPTTYALVIAMLVICYFYFRNKYPSWPQASLILGMVIIAIGVIVVTWRRTIKRQFKSNPLLQESFDCQIDKDGFRSESAGHTTDIKWSHIHKVVEGRTMFLLYQSKMAAIIVPKRAMNEGQMDALKKLLRGIDGLNVVLR